MTAVRAGSPRADRARRQGDGGRLGLLLLVTLLGLGSIYGATSVLSLPLERYFFVGAVVLAGLSAVTAMVSRQVPRSMMSLAVIWIFGIALWLVVSLTQAERDWSYIISDAALPLLPLLIAFNFSARESWLTYRASLAVLGVLLFVAAVLARAVGVEFGRHDPPSALLITIVWYFFIRSERLAHRVVLAPVLAAILYLAFSSGYRTHVVIWAAAPIAIYWFMARSRALTRSALVLAVAAGVLFVLPSLASSQFIASTRFQTLTTAGSDESLGTRGAEARDALRTAEQEWLPGQVLVGSGFGSTYVPHESKVERNIGESGRVHNIHIGPVLTVFRFGLIGVALFLSLLAIAARTLGAVRAEVHEGRDMVAVSALAVLMYSAEFLALNATVQLGFSFVVGVVIAYWFGGSRRPTSVMSTVSTQKSLMTGTSAAT